jgi:hypothetical protein
MRLMAIPPLAAVIRFMVVNATTVASVMRSSQFHHQFARLTCELNFISVSFPLTIERYFSPCDGGNNTRQRTASQQHNQYLTYSTGTVGLWQGSPERSSYIAMCYPSKAYYIKGFHMFLPSLESVRPEPSRPLPGRPAAAQSASPSSFNVASLGMFVKASRHVVP